ncbi:hypothetical protein QBC36DRAFT_246921 [Triangularia setosa]|uniref:Kinesin light chain n=1 Tax=Triangularia setosa TaxID=2587417 RepID=A0AAN6W0C3_9PEZI|nr:hypothetical protein QBC36DRAFT_246921 [Podospora setosa]
MDGMSLYGEILTQQTRWTSAAKIQTALVHMSRQTLGSEHLTTLRRMATLSILSYRLMESAKTEKLCKEVSKTRKRVLGENHASTLTATSRLVLLFSSQYEHEKAAKLQLEAFKRAEKALGKEHCVTIDCRINMALDHDCLSADTIIEGIRTICQTNPTLNKDLYSVYLHSPRLAEALKERFQWTRAEEGSLRWQAR